MEKYDVNENTWIAREYLRKFLFQEYTTGYVAIYTALHVDLDGYIQYEDSEVIADSIKAPIKTIEDAKLILLNMGVIYPVGDKYKVNPYYMYKCEWKDLCSKTHKSCCKSWNELVGSTKPQKLCSKRNFINYHSSVEFLLQALIR